jgi:Winged helix DNA-binding domain
VIALRRLRTQHLVGPPLASPVDVVGWLGAVQSQIVAAAAWGIALRSRGGLSAVADAYARGAIVRTHVLRPTWHFVLPGDLRWMQALTAARVQRQSAPYYRQHGLDARALRRADAVIVRALEDGPRMRSELATRLGATGLRLALVMMHAELGGLICSGPMHGKQHTYVLVDAVAPGSKPRPRDLALAALTLRYFTGHGPAQAADFAWWSGLTLADAREGLALVGAALASERIGDRTYYYSAAGPPAPRPRAPTAHLLPSYDEYIVAYRDRSAVHDPARLAGRRPPGVLDGNLVLLDGMLIGGWRSTVARGEATVATKLLIEPTPAEARALAAAIDRYRAAIRSSSGTRAAPSARSR